jgi:hypothetical protein
MRKLIFVLLLLTPTLALAAKPTPNPAEYTVAVHVCSSLLTRGVATFGFPDVPVQHLVAVIDAKTYELDAVPDHTELLRVGDYKAKIVQDGKPQDYEYRRIYEFLFPDGKTRQFLVVGEE